MNKSIVEGVAVAPGQVMCGVGYIGITPETPTMGTIWYHSAVANMPEMTWDAFQALMLNRFNLTVMYRSMCDDPDVDDDVELEIEHWEPKNPFVCDKAFLLVLGDDEDGPFAVWGLPQ